jgi:hypothetical protein
MYMLADLYGDAAYHVAIVDRAGAVHASKPRPVYVVSLADEGVAAVDALLVAVVRVGDTVPVAAVRGTAAKVRASLRPLGAVTSGVAAV